MDFVLQRLRANAHSETVGINRSNLIPHVATNGESCSISCNVAYHNTRALWLYRWSLGWKEASSELAGVSRLCSSYCGGPSYIEDNDAFSGRNAKMLDSVIDSEKAGPAKFAVKVRMRPR